MRDPALTRSLPPRLVLLIVILAVPRLLRLAWPEVWIEDESYLTGAFQIRQGLTPYTQIPMAHLPLLEGGLALVMLAAPVAIRTAEVLSALAALGASILVARIGERIWGPAVGITAALVFAVSSLLFRYHVFEREVFLLVPVLAATLLVVGAPVGVNSRRRGAAIGAQELLRRSGYVPGLTTDHYRAWIVERH